MLALQTDMSIPKDVNRIRLQVFVGAQLRHDETYAVAPEPGGTKLPATLAIVAGEDPNPTVQVQVIGIREEGAETLARTFAKVVTTVPKSRIATLRVPIQWLCDGSAHEIGDEQYESTCEQDEEENERACVAGDCKSVVVDSETLPDFVPEEIFGGNPGPEGISGICFDTERCFDAGFEVIPNDDCELALDVPAGGEVNVALQFPAEVDGEEGTGICGEEACYVPLDKDPVYGWSLEGEGNGAGGDDSGDEPGDGEGGAEAGGSATVKLPSSVCRRLDEGTVDAVRVSYACETKTPKYPTCGPWSAVTPSTSGSNTGGSGGSGGSVGSGGSGGDDVTDTSAGGTGNIATGTTGVAGGTACSGDDADPAVEAYLEAVLAFVPYVEQYRARTEQGCAALLKRSVTPEGLEGLELQALCDEAAIEAERIWTEEELNLVLAESYCTNDDEAQESCEESCGASETCAEPDSDTGGRCSEFAGDCETSAPCPGTCHGGVADPTACAGTCYGKCTGTCSGLCTDADGRPAADGCSGLCQGVCTGNCEGTCAATETCTSTCLGGDPSDICGGSGQNVSCQAPLNAQGCPEDLCAAGCALEAISQRFCPPGGVSSYRVEPVEYETEDRFLLTYNLGLLADVVLQTQDLVNSLAEISAAVGAWAEDPAVAEQPGLLQCMSQGVQQHSEAITSLNYAISSASSVVNSVYYTDAGIFIPGTGGTDGTGGVPPTGGTGGVGGDGGASGSGTTSSAGSAGVGGSTSTGSGGSAGVGGVAGSAGVGGVAGSSGVGGTGPLSCGFGADPDSCELCLMEICCSSAEACDRDPVCGPVSSPDSEIQCIVQCQGGYGPPTGCEYECAADGVLSAATNAFLSCSAECTACDPPIGLR